MSKISTTLLNAIQVITGIALVAGLVLVLLQLRQNEDLMRMQLYSDSVEGWKQTDAYVVGENFAQTLAKIKNPNAVLNDADLLEFDAYATSIYLQWRRASNLGGMGLWEFDLDDQVGANVVCWYFDHDVGKAWVANLDRSDEVITQVRDVLGDCASESDMLENVKASLDEKRVSH